MIKGDMEIMRINRILFTFFLILILLTQNFFVYGESELEYMTYENAYNLAIKNSYELKNLKISDEKQIIETENSLDQLGYSMFNPQFLMSYKLEKNSKLTKELNKKMEDLIKETISYNIKKIFSSVSLLNNDIEMYDKKINDFYRSVLILQAKYDYGIESQSAVYLKNIELEKMKSEKAKLEKNLKDQFIILNQILGLDLKSIYKLEEIQFEYIELNDTDIALENRINQAISKDTDLTYKINLSELAQIELDLYGFNFIESSVPIPQNNVKPYSAVKLDNTLAGNQVNQRKDEIRNIITQKYQGIKKNELEKKSLELQLKDVLEKKRIMETNLKLGIITEQEYNQIVLAVKELELGIKKLVIQHGIFMESYTNPILSSTNN